MLVTLVVSKFVYLGLFSIILPTIYCEQLVDFEKLSQNDFQNLPHNMKDSLINAIPKVMERKVIKELKDSKKENRVLVKRIVPHNKPFKIEHDDKFKILYKPLIRFHKSEKISNSIGKYLTKISPSFKIKRILLKSSKMFPKGRELANNIQKRNKILRIHQKLVDFVNSVLRSPQSDKSGEDSDQLVPEKKVQPDELETKSEKPTMWLPHYPPWNFWTYKKTVYQDVCAENQVKIGNMCVRIPPH